MLNRIIHISRKSLVRAILFDSLVVIATLGILVLAVSLCRIEQRVGVSSTFRTQNLEVDHTAAVGSNATVGSMISMTGSNGSIASTSSLITALNVGSGGWTAAMQNVTFGTLGPTLPAAPTVTDSWDPWSGGTRTSLVRVVTNQQGSILGSLKGGNVGDIVVLENHGDGSGNYGAGDLRVLFRCASCGGPPVADHIYLPDLKDIVIPYTGALVLYYDAVNVGWIPIGMSVGGQFQGLDVSEIKISHPLTPAVLPAGNTNNYDPTGGQWGKGQSEASWLRLNGDASGSTLTGLTPYAQTGPSGNAGAFQGPLRIIENIGGPIILSSEDANSSAANRFSFPNGPIEIPPNGIIVLIYDLQGGGVLNQARWRALTTVGMFSKLTLYKAVTDTALAATVNDYNPTGFSYTTRLRLAPSGGSTNLTGMQAQEDGAIRTITAYGPGLTLVHQSASSLLANRFFLPGSANIALETGGSVTLVYDATFGAWFCLNKI